MRDGRRRAGSLVAVARGRRLGFRLRERKKGTKTSASARPRRIIPPVKSLVVSRRPVTYPMVMVQRRIVSLYRADRRSTARGSPLGCCSRRRAASSREHDRATGRLRPPFEPDMPETYTSPPSSRRRARRDVTPPCVAINVPMTRAGLHLDEHADETKSGPRADEARPSPLPPAHHDGDRARVASLELPPSRCRSECLDRHADGYQSAPMSTQKISRF